MACPGQEVPDRGTLPAWRRLRSHADSSPALERVAEHLADILLDPGARRPARRGRSCGLHSKWRRRARRGLQAGRGPQARWRRGAGRRLRARWGLGTGREAGRRAGASGQMGAGHRAGAGRRAEAAWRASAAGKASSGRRDSASLRPGNVRTSGSEDAPRQCRPPRTPPGPWPHWQGSRTQTHATAGRGGRGAGLDRRRGKGQSSGCRPRSGRSSSRSAALPSHCAAARGSPRVHPR